MYMSNNLSQTATNSSVLSHVLNCHIDCHTSNSKCYSSVFPSPWVFSSFFCVFSLHMNTEHSTSLQSSPSPQSSWTLYSDISGAEASERVKTIFTSRFKHIKASKECYLLGQNTTCKFSDNPLYQTIKQTLKQQSNSEK